MRDFATPHPTIVMDGKEPCGTCIYAVNLGYCTKHQTQVSFLDGCSSHVKMFSMQTSEGTV